MKKMKVRLAVWCLALVAVVGFVAAPVAFADTKGSVQEGINKVGGTENKTSLESFFGNIIGILLFIIGAISVIMIIVGGIRYATSNGDQAHIKAAKDTILYAIIGLAVAILAFAIVTFVTNNLQSPSGQTPTPKGGQTP